MKIAGVMLIFLFLLSGCASTKSGHADIAEQAKNEMIGVHATITPISKIGEPYEVQFWVNNKSYKGVAVTSVSASTYVNRSLC